MSDSQPNLCLNAKSTPVICELQQLAGGTIRMLLDVVSRLACYRETSGFVG